MLAPAKAGLRGRRPEVDFAVVETFPKVTAVVETKWVGPDGLTAADVLWDLMRLELIAHQEKAKAFFVLAGRRKHLVRYFESRAFLGKPRSDGRLRPLLTLRHSRHTANIPIVSPTPDRQAVIAKLLPPYQQIAFPQSVTTSSPAIYPETCTTFQYQAYVWEVYAPKLTARFLPANHSAYRVSPA